MTTSGVGIARTFLLALFTFACARATRGASAYNTITPKAVAAMGEGQIWTTENVGVATANSYCYDDSAEMCQRYGRLYTWKAAMNVCVALGPRWRLPKDADWRLLSRRYGGASDESADSGHRAFRELTPGGSAKFNAKLGGGRDGHDGRYARIEAHGFYWTSTEDGAETAVYYNFGKGGLALHRQTEGEKSRAFAVRCVKDER